MTNRRNTIQKDLVKNAVYEMKRHVTANDLLFLQNKKCTNCREMNTMRGLSRKLYLDLSVPTEEDQRSDQQRILEALSAEGVKEEVHIPVRMLRQLYPLLDRAGWKITVSLSWNGEKWELVDIESGDTARQHYGLAVDLGSTTVVVRLLDCNSGEILGEESCFNKQIQWGTDILSRIFFCKDDRKKLEEIRLATVESIIECMDKLDVKHPVSRKCLSMVVAGNTTMIHFLLGIDAFCVFYTPHVVHADRPGFQPAKDLDIPLNGYVYCYPAKSNYLGGDIISGMIETELYKKDGISVFFDIGTNGELVIGNKDFLLCGAGAAGPALEGGVVHTGMRADAGAVDGTTGKGRKLGAMTGIFIDTSGRIYGTYDNGNTELLGQIAVAQFSNASGLEKVGESCYRTTLNSGEFDGIGVEISADGSSMTTGELEMSNVDLSSEFTSMITTQRGFQANSRVITTSDTLLEELVNLKR